MKKWLLFVSLLVTSITANAAFFEGSVSGVFDNAQGPSGMVSQGEGTNSFRWGTGVYNPDINNNSQPSQIAFLGNSFSVETDINFNLGYIYSYSGNIHAGTEASSVDFFLTLDFYVPNTFQETFGYSFAIDNSASSQGHTATLLSAAPQYLYSYEGVDYYFELLGFGYGNSIHDELFVPEMYGSLVNLMGKFSSIPSAVPLPAAVWLFGSGLMGFMAFRRRAKANAVSA